MLLKNALSVAGKRVLVTHYADPLKFICHNLFGWDGQKNDIGRALLQYVGTDRIRKEDPDYFVRFLGWLIELFRDEWDYVVIPDARFKNEIDRMKMAFPTTAVSINRTGYESQLSDEAQAHISENALNDYRFDVVVENETLEGLSRSSVALANFIMNPAKEWKGRTNSEVIK